MELQSNDHPADHTRPILPSLMIGGGIATAALVAMPYVLPLVGVGDSELAAETAAIFHNEADGLAGNIAAGIQTIPMIGEPIARGGWANTAAALTSSAGGVLLGGFVSKHRKEDDRINWGKLIKVAGLATSALIAMPMLLTALTTSLSYMTNVLDTHEIISIAQSNQVAGVLSDTLGTVGGDYQHNIVGAAGLGALLPHFLTCGTSVGTAILSTIMLANDDQVLLNPAHEPKDATLDVPKNAVEKLALQRQMDQNNTACASLWR